MIKLNSKIKTILRWLVGTFFLILTIFIIATTDKSPFKFKLYSVLSDSMSPSFYAGSLLIVDKEDKNISEGDIITYRLDGKLITHRVNKVINENNQIIYKTKGDANSQEDFNPVPSYRVEGKVIYIIPITIFGKFISFIKTQLGYLLLIVLPSIFIIVLEVISIMEERRKKLEKIAVEKALKEASLSTESEQNQQEGKHLDNLRHKVKNKYPIRSILFIFFVTSFNISNTYSIFTSTGEVTPNIFHISTLYSRIQESNAFTCENGASENNMDGGYVIFNFEDESTYDLTINLKVLESNTDFDLSLNEIPDDCSENVDFEDIITTDENGNASMTLENLPRLSNTTGYWIKLTNGEKVYRTEILDD